MAKVLIIKSLKDEILKKFKGSSKVVFKLMYSLENQSNKGKLIGSVGGLLIKELKYEGFRFYFIVDGNKIRFLSGSDIENLFIRFVRMSDKKNQQKIINEIKDVLLRVGEGGF